MIAQLSYDTSTHNEIIRNQIFTQMEVNGIV